MLEKHLPKKKNLLIARVFQQWSVSKGIQQGVGWLLNKGGIVAFCLFEMALSNGSIEVVGVQNPWLMFNAQEKKENVPFVEMFKSCILLKPKLYTLSE